VTITLPRELENLKWFVGIDPPEADEDALWRSAQAWRAAAAELRRVASDAERTGAGVAAAIEGEAAAAFAQAWQPFVTDDGLLRRLAQACDELAAACDHAATEVEYAKLAFIVALVALAVTLAALTAAAVAGGVSALGVPLAVAGAQFTIRMLLARLVVAIVVGAAVNVAMDSVVQAVQLVEGHRDRWNTAQTARAAEDGAIYGAATGLVFLGGARLAPGLMSNPWGTGGALGATGLLGGVGAGLVHGDAPTATGVVMAMVSGVVGGLGPGPHFHRPLANETGRAAVAGPAADMLRLDLDGPALTGYADVYRPEPRVPTDIPLDVEGPPRPVESAPIVSGLAALAPTTPHTPGGGGFLPVGPAAGSGPGAAVPPAPGPPSAPAAPGSALRSELPLRADPPAPGPLGTPGPLASAAAGSAAGAAPPASTVSGAGPSSTVPGPGPSNAAPDAASRAPGALTPVPPGAAGPVVSPPTTGAATVVGGTGPAAGTGPAGPDLAVPAVVAAMALNPPPVSPPAHSPPSLDTITMTSGPTGPALPVNDHEALALARHTVFETDAGYGFYAPGDNTRDFAQAIVAREGYVTLDVHGTTRGFRIEGGLLTAEQFATALRELEREDVVHLPPGAGIKLISCDTATGGDASPAAALAHALGLEVIAPDQPVWTAMDGEEIVASPRLRDGTIVPADPPDGRWHRFGPAGNELG
jgi:hypothetical protein